MKPINFIRIPTTNQTIRTMEVVRKKGSYEYIFRHGDFRDIMERDAFLGQLYAQKCYLENKLRVLQTFESEVEGLE